ncbi:hypothetical protein BC938DRAFT_477543 [Jimgerdemannia flammicorona]|uniref:Uncharacterized protein n=1 Tax=Jimgerdemannia flammicorona TaxID=994334 RepID=A0A433QP84_9FUNG|nr:hypothetical protein BC938DRAFT_477543 [Jimgerdemannia flammicorona]
MISHICRVFVVLCRAVGALQRVRVFCFDLMREPIENSHLLLLFVNVAIMWPETLSHPAMPDGADTGLGQNLILRTFESILAGIHEDCEKPSTVGAVSIIFFSDHHAHKTYHLYYICRLFYDLKWRTLVTIIWRARNPLSLEQAKRGALLGRHHQGGYICVEAARIPSTSFRGGESRFNLVKSIELAVYYHGEWEYLYEHIISNVLWPLMKDGHVVDMSLEIIGVLGRSSLLEEEEKTGIHALRQKMEDVLNLGHDVDQADFILQIHAARSLFLLVNGEIKYLTGLFKWYREIREPNRWQLPPSLVRDVEYLRDLR